MTLEKKVAEYVEIRGRLAELENQKKLLVAEILELIPKEQTSVELTEFCVKRASLFSIKISLENARNVGAVAMKEVVDKDKIKELFRSGQDLPGVSENHFIRVSARVASDALSL